MTTVLSFLFVLGVLVFVHELGHFLMARRIGVRVITFSLGFGPKLLSYRRGDTEYCVSAVPLGGYVKMAGENPDDPRSGRPDEFLSKTKWQRLQVLIMGPAMNILLAVVLLAIVLMNGAQVPAFQDQPPVLGAVQAGSPAAAAGLRPGDLIVRVGRDETPTWEAFYMAVGTRPNRQVDIQFLREGRTEHVQITPSSETKFEVGDIGVLPDVHPSVRPPVVPGDPADKAGIQRGDVVLAVNGERITFARQLSEAIAKHPEEPIVITVERAGSRRDIRVTPVRRNQIGWIGIGISDQVKIIDPGPLQAIVMSVQRNVQYSGLIFKTIWGLVTQETSPRQLMGPVAIAQLSGESAQAGLIALFSLMASISLNLGLLNLLPIPVLDGGHIAILALEGLTRRDFSTRLKEKMLLAGFVLLMMLMVTVIYNDLTRVTWIERLMPWRR
ncbi:MAG: RIP metalloprotease RseP [Acidobacteria bacterium]|nr:RIP metalloprotease RseP [Acidobacteriota bacterium]